VGKLFEFDQRYRLSRSISFIAGVDESGRGPLAGPVVAAAVILRPGFRHKGINDCKKLTASKREKLFVTIKRNALGIGISVVKTKTIDDINILSATFLAMRRAVRKLPVRPELVLIDGPYRIPGIKASQDAVVGGDSKSISIASASIIAKVTRDGIMGELDRKYPQYKFGQNKGYPTKKHYDAIKLHGISPVHRLSFRLI
jgi:ribonuclease HII